MQRVLLKPAILSQVAYRPVYSCVTRSFSSHTAHIGGGKERSSKTGKYTPVHVPRSEGQKPPISLRSLGKLLNGPITKGPKYKPKKKNIGCWSLRLYVRRIRGLVSSLAPAYATAAVEYVSSEPNLPETLRPRVMTKAVYFLLRAGNFPGALKIYRAMLADGFSPPEPLVAALYRGIKSNAARKTVIDPTSEIQLRDLSYPPSPLNQHHLASLLSTLEPLKRPELMEDIVTTYIARNSESCIGDPSVAASMIRAYHKAGQLDGCYNWFHKYKHYWAFKGGSIPASPYVCLMAASRKLMPSNTAALYRIVETMREDGVTLTIIVYNEILASELRNRNFRGIFSAFRSLEAGTHKLQPDAYTLSLIFDALWKNVTGPCHDIPISPNDILKQMLFSLPPSALTVHSSNAALRYFTHIGDFSSGIEIIKSMMIQHVSPNSLTVRWILEEVLKRCLVAFNTSASPQLCDWASLFLGGLTRDHLAHTSHLLDVVHSTRDDTQPHKLTRPTKDALFLVHKMFVSGRSSPAFTKEDQRKDFPALAQLHDLLYVCAYPACGI
ncbi:hypothetical protein RSOLAG1IB_03686 [Rhizoctonia solani AG-1 IB]|uniref:PPR domain-containing protein n=1 Tax=Thanatephorus cucumeris (strain AG1-IB / isolate 7/3/14) TaxID=1108050 RepID=A0A0B7FU46_THACB|nr:hypothetical protein RSOLAG1IB_03686 [Rhizoctonia solani AG-1 IB]